MWCITGKEVKRVILCKDAKCLNASCTSFGCENPKVDNDMCEHQEEKRLLDKIDMSSCEYFKSEIPYENLVRRLEFAIEDTREGCGNVVKISLKAAIALLERMKDLGEVMQ